MSGANGILDDAGRPAASIVEACRHMLERAPMAFAVTRGPDHVLIAANEAFRSLGANRDDPLDRPIAQAAGLPELLGLLDPAFGEGVIFRDRPVGGSDEKPVWSCTVWPWLADGRTGGLVIELRAAAPADPTLAVQRDIAERLLLGALRENFLADAGRRLAESIDEDTTRRAVSAMHLPSYGSWCIVDVIEAGGAMHRLAIIHPDPVKHAAARKLENDWSPRPGDPFGAPAMLVAAEPLAITANVMDAVALASHSAEHLAVLRELGIGSLLTVPMIARGELLGAMTFVRAARDGSYTREERRLAEELALQSAMALDSARLYGEAVALRAKAQEASHVKSEFLGHMSHELRTPLNAIGGYVDIIDLGIHGPVTDAQHGDLDRIRVNQQHLLVMINEILSFMHVESGRIPYDIADLPVHEVVADAVALVEPLIVRNELEYHGVSCDRSLIVRGDRNRVQQILTNLLTNAVKFTPPGGRIGVECEAAEDTALITVSDTGIGISPDLLGAVFEPFVQLRSGLTGRQGGVGLGLAISRDLARAMQGDLTVESTPAEGSRFTLSLPRAAR